MCPGVTLPDSLKFKLDGIDTADEFDVSVTMDGNVYTVHTYTFINTLNFTFILIKRTGYWR